MRSIYEYKKGTMIEHKMMLILSIITANTVHDYHNERPK